MSDGVLGDWLAQQAAARLARGLHRDLVPRSPEPTHIDLAGNDYLGLSRDPRVVAAAVDAVQTWGAGATASRLVTGTTRLHADLEAALASFMQAPAALAFATGYAANLAVVTALGDDDTLIVSDAANHASLIDGCRLARGRTVVTPHADVEAVAAALADRSETRALVLTDAVFSVDGDLAPVRDLHEVCVRHRATLIVDEAHALGVVGPGGRGAVVAAGVAGSPDVIRTVTLSKSLGAQGGAVLASAAVVAHLVDTGRTFIFDTGLAPPAAGAALAALDVLAARPDLAEQVRQNAAVLARGLGLRTPDAAVVSLAFGDPTHALDAARRCAARGVRVGCFRPPSVPAGSSRLRITARADLSADDVAYAVDTIRQSVAAVA